MGFHIVEHLLGFSLCYMGFLLELNSKDKAWHAEDFLRFQVFLGEFCATPVVVLVRVSVEEIGGVKGHFGPINAMAFNPDWRRSDGRISGRLSGRNLITNAVAVECCFVIEDMSIQVNVPALAMEEVAPLAVSDAAMLAPEEIFHGKGNIKEEAELTKEERKRRRANQKRRFRRLKARPVGLFVRPIDFSVRSRSSLGLSTDLSDNPTCLPPGLSASFDRPLCSDALLTQSL
ncbi:hypothetical protein ZIOFF_011826 [Zingiber officinale]|uniref:Uncharacterized protein n=1 Tax=Zingiber officinale TaxID=94328 RepID=A0A8J5HJS8_ZINOF|nr:hypothetical protein ZIOFF_011826 [Zingiber officinale]